MAEHDVRSSDGRIHAYDTGGDGRLSVVYLHGTPNIGAPPAPLSRRPTGSACRAGAGLVRRDGDGAAATLRAAVDGRAARERVEVPDDDETSADIDIGFILQDWVALSGPWSWLLEVVQAAQAGGPQGAIDDDLAYVARWGFDPASIEAPVLLVHGARDRMVPSSHSAWLAARCPAAELRVIADAGHVSVLAHAEEALAWIAARPA